MPVLLEISELIRALGFPGSDAIFLISLALLGVLILSVRAGVAYWVSVIVFVGIPLVFAVTSRRIELAMTAFSIASFFALLKSEDVYAGVSLVLRFAVFVILVVASYLLTVGEPIYYQSAFNSIFESANAFVYYLLLTACMIAFMLRSVFVTATLAMPLALIQTKSVVILAISSRLTAFLALLMLYPLYLIISSVGRISWFISEYGVVYALGAGRIQRFAERAASTFTPDMLIFGSPFPVEPENFEIEFVDFAHDFGLVYAVAFFIGCFILLSRAVNDNFMKLAAVFVLLNLAGHFWNNPLLVVTFVALVRYVGSADNEHVPR